MTSPKRGAGTEKKSTRAQMLERLQAGKQESSVLKSGTIGINEEKKSALPSQAEVEKAIKMACVTVNTVAVKASKQGTGAIFNVLGDVYSNPRRVLINVIVPKSRLVAAIYVGGIDENGESFDGVGFDKFMPLDQKLTASHKKLQLFPNVFEEVVLGCPPNKFKELIPFLDAGMLDRDLFIKTVKEKSKDCPAEYLKDLLPLVNVIGLAQFKSLANKKVNECSRDKFKDLIPLLNAGILDRDLFLLAVDDAIKTWPKTHRDHDNLMAMLKTVVISLFQTQKVDPVLFLKVMDDVLQGWPHRDKSCNELLELIRNDVSPYVKGGIVADQYAMLLGKIHYEIYVRNPSAASLQNLAEASLAWSSIRNTASLSGADHLVLAQVLNVVHQEALAEQKKDMPGTNYTRAFAYMDIATIEKEVLRHLLAAKKAGPQSVADQANAVLANVYNKDTEMKDTRAMMEANALIERPIREFGLQSKKVLQDLPKQFGMVKLVNEEKKLSELELQIRGPQDPAKADISDEMKETLEKWGKKQVAIEGFINELPSRIANIKQKPAGHEIVPLRELERSAEELGLPPLKLQDWIDVIAQYENALKRQQTIAGSKKPGYLLFIEFAHVKYLSNVSQDDIQDKIAELRSKMYTDLVIDSTAALEFQKKNVVKLALPSDWPSLNLTMMKFRNALVRLGIYGSDKPEYEIFVAIADLKLKVELAQTLVAQVDIITQFEDALSKALKSNPKLNAVVKELLTEMKTKILPVITVGLVKRKLKSADELAAEVKQEAVREDVGAAPAAAPLKRLKEKSAPLSDKEKLSPLSEMEGALEDLYDHLFSKRQFGAKKVKDEIFSSNDLYQQLTSLIEQYKQANNKVHQLDVAVNMAEVLEGATAKRDAHKTSFSDDQTALNEFLGSLDVSLAELIDPLQQSVRKEDIRVQRLKDTLFVFEASLDKIRKPSLALAESEALVVSGASELLVQLRAMVRKIEAKLGDPVEEMLQIQEMWVSTGNLLDGLGDLVSQNQNPDSLIKVLIKLENYLLDVKNSLEGPSIAEDALARKQPQIAGALSEQKAPVRKEEKEDSAQASPSVASVSQTDKAALTQQAKARRPSFAALFGDGSEEQKAVVAPSKSASERLDVALDVFMKYLAQKGVNVLDYNKTEDGIRSVPAGFYKILKGAVDDFKADQSLRKIESLKAEIDTVVKWLANPTIGDEHLGINKEEFLAELRKLDDIAKGMVEEMTPLTKRAGLQ